MTAEPAPEMEKPAQITFRYCTPDHLADCYVSGFYGGVAPSGKIYCHFFSERPAIPNSETRELQDNGTIGKRLAIETEGDIVRLVQSSIVFDLHTAKEMAHWLQAQVEHMESRSRE